VLIAAALCSVLVLVLIVIRWSLVAVFISHL
jgi:hypothetical protein